MHAWTPGCTSAQPPGMQRANSCACVRVLQEGCACEQSWDAYTRGMISACVHVFMLVSWNAQCAHMHAPWNGCIRAWVFEHTPRIQAFVHVSWRHSCVSVRTHLCMSPGCIRACEFKRTPCLHRAAKLERELCMHACVSEVRTSKRAVCMHECHCCEMCNLPGFEGMQTRALEKLECELCMHACVSVLRIWNASCTCMYV